MALVVAAVSEDGRDAGRWEVFGVTDNQQAVFPGNPGEVNAPGRPVVNALGAYWSHDKTDDELGLVKVSQDTHADCLGCAVQSSTVAVLEGVAIKTVSDYHAVHSDSLVAAVACGKQTVADVAVAATDGLKKSADFPAEATLLGEKTVVWETHAALQRLHLQRGFAACLEDGFQADCLSY